MMPATISNELGTWQWIVRPMHMEVRQGDTIIDEADAIGPTATVDPRPMINGAWWADDPWFESPTDAQRAFFVEAGFPSTLVEAAIAGLKRLLPREVCAKLATDHDTRMFIAPLYQRYALFLRPLLDLGCDLAEADAWTDTHTIQRLLIPTEHWGASTEIAVLAALRRAGFKPDREPRGRDNKAPEYLVHLDFWRYFIEVKTNRKSLGETRADQLEDFLRPTISIPPGKHLSVVGSERLRRFLQDPNALIPHDLGRDLRNDLRNRLAEIAKAGFPVGTSSAGELLLASVEEVPIPSRFFYSVALLPEVTPEKHAYRIVRKVRDAAEQIPQAASGIAVVDVGHARNMVVVKDVLTLEFKRRPEVFDPIKAVILHIPNHTETGHFERIVVGVPLPGRVPNRAESALIKALLAPR